MSDDGPDRGDSDGFEEADRLEMESEGEVDEEEVEEDEEEVDEVIDEEASYEPLRANRGKPRFDDDDVIPPSQRGRHTGGARRDQGKTHRPRRGRDRWAGDDDRRRED